MTRYEREPWDDDELGDGTRFREPGSRSALRAGARRYKCPGCGRPRMLSQADRERGYVCDRCADRAEMGLDY